MDMMPAQIEPAPATGRPSRYSDDVASTICQRIAEGEPLADICKDVAMPSRSTIYRWLREHGGFSHMYSRAREERADLFADQIIQIADDSTADHNDRRVRVDARKWAAAKLNPKRYGDRLTHQGDDENPVQVVTGIRVTYVKPTER
jgi:hypothetical protein